MKPDVRISRAFKNVKHPGLKKLIKDEVCYQGDIEFLFKYEKSHWSEIDNDELASEGACLSFLSFEGVKYVLPRYLMLFLEDEVNDPNGWVDRLLLVLSKAGLDSNCFLTDEQFSVVHDIFLIKVKESWDRYGVDATTFGDNWDELIRNALRLGEPRTGQSIKSQERVQT